MSMYDQDSSYSARRSAPPRSFPLVPLLLLAVVGGALIWRFWPDPKSGLNPDAAPRAITPRGDLASSEKSNIEVYQQALPSVVHVTNVAEVRDLFNLDVQQEQQGTGTGIVWDQEGHIVTNFHVVQNANLARVILSDKDRSSYETRKIFVFPDKDLAILHIDAPKSKLQPIRLGSSSDLQVGQYTYAIGNPFGLDGTMTMGIVSALGRTIRSLNGRAIHDVIQTSAAINPGNSGGPLLDSAGRLIGVNTQIVSPSGASAGIGFAIPVDEVNRVVPQLIAHGKIVRPRLGVEVCDDQQAHRWGVKSGALIRRVQPGTPAAQANLRGIRESRSGLLLGDIIVAIDNKPVKSRADLLDILDKYHIGDTITVNFIRDEESQQVQVTLQAVE